MKLVIAICMMMFAAAASADSTFTIGAGTGPECDMTYLNQASPTTVNGSSTGAYFYDSVAGGSNVNLMFRWDAIGDSLNKSGTLVYVKACSLIVKSIQLAIDNPTQGVLKIARTRRNPVAINKWNEGAATWNVWKAVSGNWATAGARSTTGDVDTSAMSTLNFATNTFGSDSVLKIDMTTAAQTMDGADTANSHCGWLIFAPWWGSFTTMDLLAYIATDDHATTAIRPKLKVVYTKAVQPAASATNNLRRRTANVRHSFSYKEKINAYCIIG